jgi:tetratricopeptide (TPR) repeat protein
MARSARGELVAGRFRIEEEVDAGAMGTIFRAVDVSSGATVALKLLRIKTDEGAARIGREARVLASLEHPGIVRHVAHGSSKQGRFVAMEWLAGEDLGKRLERGVLSIEEASSVARRIGGALAAVHEAGLVHRDIKPRNVFLVGGEATDVKLLDFGLARSQGADDTDELTASGILVGTPSYMAPEQARGDRGVDGKADVFALGCVLFKCLTGVGPFTGADAVATLAKILFEDARPLSELRADVPSGLVDLVEAMLAKERDGRPSAAEVVAALLESGPPSAHGPASARRQQLSDREQRVVSVVVAARGALGDPEATLARTPEPPFSSRAGDLDRLGRELGAHVAILARGVIAWLSGKGAATDQAAAAARLALGVRGLLPDVPVAVATGRAVLGKRVAGEVIERAAARAAAGIGSAGGVWVDDVTEGLLSARFEIAGPEGEREVVGERLAPIAMRKLRGEPTPFVGRERELRTLGDLFAEAEDESVARAVLVVGEAGLGKSRLLLEWKTSLEARATPPGVWTLRADAVSRGVPYSLLAQWIRRAAKIAPGEPPASARTRLNRHVEGALGAGGAARRVAEFLGEAIGAPFPEGASRELRSARADPVLMGNQMRRAWDDWIKGEVARGPLVLFVEDAHWGDVPSVEQLSLALRSSASAPFIVVASARPEVYDAFPVLAKDWAAQQISLAPLRPKAAARLVASVLGDAVSGEVVARIVAQGNGNPFFLEEIVRAHATGTGVEPGAPGTVRAFLQRRLEGFGADDRRVLRAASVFGGAFRRDGVLALLGGVRRRGWLDACLERLVGVEIFVERGSDWFAFAHALVRDAAYDALTDDDRKLGHRLAAEWLELGGDVGDAVLAEHFERSDQPVRAISRLVRAAAQSLQANDPTSAIELAQRGERTGASAMELGELLQVKAQALRWRGKLGEAEANAREAIALLLPSTPAWYAAIGELAVVATALGHKGEVQRVAELLSSAASAGAGDPARVVALAHVGMSLLMVGEREQGEALVKLAAAIDVGDHPTARAWLAQARAFGAAHASDNDTYYDCIAEVRAIYEAAGDVFNACVQSVNMSNVVLQAGALEEAEALLVQALAEASSAGFERIAAVVDLNIGMLRLLQGRLAESVTVLSSVADKFVVAGDVRFEAFSRIHLAAACAASGDVPRALAEARRAVRLTESVAPLRAMTLATLADLELAHGSKDRALELACEAHAIAERPGGIEDGEAMVRAVHADALASAGRTDDARRALRDALAKLASVAGKITRPGWRESFLSRVPANARILRRARELGVSIPDACASVTCTRCPS